MLLDRLENYRIILGSGSPRRKQLLEELGLQFEVKPIGVEETYPPDLKGADIADYLAELKSNAYPEPLSDNDLLITSDTIVWSRDTMLAKPADRTEALTMIKQLSDDWHEVITSINLRSASAKLTDHCSTEVRFRELEEKEIEFYVDKFRPYDKAGAYGIQEWIGMIGITEIRGSYSNVVGLPTALLWKMFDKIT